MNENSEKPTEIEKIVKWMTEKDSINNDVNNLKMRVDQLRVALKAALKENKVLSEKCEDLEYKNELLEAEVKHLSGLAEEGIQLRNIIEEYEHNY